MRHAITDGFRNSIDSMKDSCGMDPAQVVHMMLVTQYLDTLKQVLCMRVHGTCMCCVCACITMNVVLGALAVCASQAGMDLNTPTHPHTNTIEQFAESGSATMVVPHGPSSVADIESQVRSEAWQTAMGHRFLAMAHTHARTQPSQTRTRHIRIGAQRLLAGRHGGLQVSVMMSTSHLPRPPPLNLSQSAGELWTGLWYGIAVHMMTHWILSITTSMAMLPCRR